LWRGDLKGEAGSVDRQLVGGEDTLLWLWRGDLKGETGSEDRQLVGGEDTMLLLWWGDVKGETGSVDRQLLGGKTRCYGCGGRCEWRDWKLNGGSVRSEIAN